MRKATTSERLKQIMNEENLKQVDILNMSLPYQKKLNIKMSKSHLSQYVNGKSNPDQNKLYLLGKTLNVSEAWLMGFDVSRDRIPDEERKTNEIETKLISVFNQLNEDNKKATYDFAAQKLEEQKNVVPFGVPIKEETNKAFHTIAAHSDDPNRTYTEEEIEKIDTYLEKEKKKYMKMLEKYNKE